MVGLWHRVNPTLQSILSREKVPARSQDEWWCTQGLAAPGTNPPSVEQKMAGLALDRQFLLKGC
jgi:hypothetical protein